MAVSKHKYRDGREHQRDGSQKSKRDTVVEAGDERVGGKREECAHQAAGDNDGGQARGGVQAERVDNVGHEREVSEHHGRAEHARGGEKSREREAELHGPAVEREDAGEHQGAEDDEREPEFGTANALVGGA